MGLFDKIKLDQKQQQQDANVQYHMLLARIDPDDATEADAKTLADLLSKLGKTPEQAERDRQRIVEVRDRLKLVADHPQQATVEWR